MKIKQTNYLILATILGCLMCLTVLNGCKKDNEDDKPEVKSYRLKSFTYIRGGTALYNTSIQYNAENKITKITQEKNGVEVKRDEWSWDGNKVVIRNSFLSDSGTWVSRGITAVITYTNGKVSKTEYPINDSLSFSVIYTWNGDLLTEKINQLWEHGNLSWVMNNDYTYDNNLLTTTISTVEGMLVQKDIIEYENGKLVRISSYNSDNVLIEATAITHTGDVISQVDKLHVDQGIQGEVDCIETLAYDNNGCLNTHTRLCDGDDETLITQIVHEEGTGNYSDLTLTNSGWLTYYLLPDSYPSNIIYQLKK